MLIFDGRSLSAWAWCAVHIWNEVDIRQTTFKLNLPLRRPFLFYRNMAIVLDSSFSLRNIFVDFDSILLFLCRLFKIRSLSLFYLNFVILIWKCLILCQYFPIDHKYVILNTIVPLNICKELSKQFRFTFYSIISFKKIRKSL